MEYLVAILILSFFGIACAIKANRKGLCVWAWSILGLAFGPLGWVLCTLQPDRRKAQREFAAQAAALQTAEGIENVATMLKADRAPTDQKPRGKVGV